ncbi:MAG: DUF1800 domain-containing protein [Methylacidiphilales bacterium]|nr:DUF1800 domain-containing protein [Candidatus Methylacidiphilales bacterium]
MAGLIQAQDATSDRAEIVHVLNRITFGPRPGDVEKVEQMGLRNYIEQQLHPESIDDSAVEKDVARFELLQMSPQQLSQLFLEDTKRFIKKQKEKQAADAGQTGQGAQAVTSEATPPAGGGTMNLINQASQWRSVAAIGQLEQAKLVRAVDSQRQLQEVLVDFWGNHFNVDVKKGPDRVYKIIDDRDVIRPHIWGSFRDLLEASAKSPAMLFYLDNASNTVQRDMTPLEQEMREMYFQKTLGIADPENTTQPGEPMKTKKQGGINENYAREIMELHTLGVDGGYTQQDVQEVARCFTGWTINRMAGEFIFRPRLHDNGAKVVLGHEIPAGGGIQDGETVLDILCASPATAHHIALEMCQRFVSDNPPPSLVERIAGVFQATNGNLSQVTEAILTSPEFLSPSDYGNKIKSPLEFAVSAVRASDSTLIAQQPPPFDKLVPAMEGGGVMGRGQVADRISHRPRQSLNWHILELGEPLFACTPPTGYKEVSSTWVSPGALIERLNFAMALTGQELSDVVFDPQRILDGIDVDHPEDVLNRCVTTLLQNNITDATRKVLEKTALPAPGESQTVNPSKLIALMIGSPEFQRK